jgi:predicted RNA-binding Zn-ribbon protein involved in translation (DUF1610 family)
MKYGEADYTCPKCGKHIDRCVIHHCEEEIVIRRANERRI